MQNRTDAEAWEIVLDHEDAINFWIHKLPFMPANMEFADFQQEGLLVGFRCAKRWDPTKGAFVTLFVPRLKGTFFDMLYPDRRRPERWGKQDISLDFQLTDGGDTFATLLPDPKGEFDLREVETEIAWEQYLTTLPKRIAWIMDERSKERSMQDIADDLGVSEARISQLCKIGNVGVKELVA
jgi:RNA polymerase sigma factor (sigma-70 family)